MPYHSIQPDSGLCCLLQQTAGIHTAQYHSDSEAVHINQSEPIFTEAAAHDASRDIMTLQGVRCPIKVCVYSIYISIFL